MSDLTPSPDKSGEIAARVEAATATATGAELIATERARHPELGWDAAHDRGHGDDLETAARCYRNGFPMGPTWPWDMKYWKPKGRLINLIRAGALMQAAFDAIDPSDNSDHAYFSRKHRPKMVESITRELDRFMAEQARAEFDAAAPEDIRYLLGLRNAVLALHTRKRIPIMRAYYYECAECKNLWPCLTVRALGVTS